MGFSKVNDLKTTDSDVKILQLKKKLFNLHFKKATRQQFKPHQFKHIKREIAQILTLKSQQS
jgi:large subunit ribosomal protein L29